MSGAADARTARVMLGVRGMDTDGARAKVTGALMELRGVHGVEPGGGQALLVRYDSSELTVMDMIRAVRRLGFLAGMA